MGKKITRRDFLKLSALIPFGLKPAEFALKLLREGFMQSHAVRNVIYEGRVMSIHQLATVDQGASIHLESVLGDLATIDSTGQTPSSCPGYLGNPVGEGEKIDFDKMTIKVGRSKPEEGRSGKVITQVLTERISPGDGMPVTDKYGTEISNSLLVYIEGNETRPVFFDRTESFNGVGFMKNRIVVNNQDGAVIQISNQEKEIKYWPPDNPLVAVQKIFTTQNIQKLDLDTLNLEMAYSINSPIILDILGLLNKALKSKTTGLADDELKRILDDLYDRVFSTDANPTSRSNFFIDFNKKYNVTAGDPITQVQSELIQGLDKRFISDIPLEASQSFDFIDAFLLIMKSQEDPNVKALLDQAKGQLGYMESLTLQILQNDKIKYQKLNEEMIRNEIQLPDHMPQLVVFPLVDAEGKRKYVMAARYESEKMQVIGGQRSGTDLLGEKYVFIGESDYDPLDNMSWANVLGYGKLSNDTSTGIWNLYDRQAFANNFSALSDNENLSNLDFSRWERAKYIGYSLDQRLPTYVSSNGPNPILKWYYDPEPSQQKIFAGFELIYNNEDEEIRKIFEIRPNDHMLTTHDYKIVKPINNRPFIYVGNFPYAVLEVTDPINDLIRRGHKSVSALNLMPHTDAAAMMVGLTEQPEFGLLRQYLQDSGIELPHINSNIKEKAHSLVIATEETSCTKYRIIKGPFGNWGTITYFPEETKEKIVPKNMVLGAFEIKKLENRDGVLTDMIIIAGHDNENYFYAVPLESMMFAGVESNISLMLAKVAAAGATLYGGYQLATVLKESGLAKQIFGPLMKAILGK